MIAGNLRNLVTAVTRHFRKQPAVPDRTRLASLFETAFLASMITDEGRKVTCSVSVFDAEQTTNDVPQVVRTDRWSVVPLANPVPLTPEHLARFSQAIPPDAGAIAVRPTTNEGWIIWAVIDQEHLVHGFRHHKEDKFYPRAGRFQIEVVGPGCISVYHDTALLARLQRDSLATDFQDVFHDGPIAEALGKLADAHLSRVVQAIRRWQSPSDRLDGNGVYGPIEIPELPFKLWLDRARERWLEALSGVLLQIRQLRHGGALLLLPKSTLSDLKFKHAIDYCRMDQALVERCASDVMAWAFRHFGLDTNDEERLHVMLLDLQQAERRNADAVRAQAGTMQFIASLTGVDGLVVAVRGLSIRGFGVEIVTKRDPDFAFLALNPCGTAGERIDPTRWGTRHRSMMRYCARHKGSVGFVVSQDGDVRAMMRVADRLLVWPNVALERSAMQPLEVPCPHCSSVGDLFPIRPIGDDDDGA
ncbi:putative sensor domain DACNV-containing protein [Sorangium sp. So ce1153]|uniref:putative sensor domain DACNV-containing protein n=1 Tax=Sorangium sp. So ce1153 TaxID=3133333 RepID=UPI003F6175C3